jgi:tRNA-specific 2-thiouridylase
LIKGNDPGKDQSYFLYTIKEDILRNVMFPIGHLPKDTVRALANEHGLSVHDKPDSTGICFIGERSFKPFLSQYIKPNPGNFETPEGKVVGKHDGIAFYTIGQRKGMGIGGAGEAWFVVGKDVPRNVVIVAQGTRHPSLFCDELEAVEATWVTTPPQTPFKCTAKVRYRQPDQPCEITRIEGDRVHVKFAIPQRAVTPRQSVVFYDGTTCLGGAIIQTPGPTYFERKLPLPEVVSP